MYYEEFFLFKLKWSNTSTDKIIAKNDCAVVSSCSQTSFHLLLQLAFVVYFQYSIIVIVEIDLLCCLVCQTVPVTITGFAKTLRAEKPPIPVLS